MVECRRTADNRDVTNPYMSTWQKVNDEVVPTDYARVRWLGMGVVRAAHSLRRTFKPKPRVTHSVDSVLIVSKMLC